MLSVLGRHHPTPLSDLHPPEPIRQPGVRSGSTGSERSESLTETYDGLQVDIER